MKLNLAVIGTGAIFKSYHLPSILRFKDLNLKYVVDLNLNLAKKIASEYNATPLQNAADIRDCDICFIATPPSSREAVFNAIKDKNMHLVFEKPLAFNYETCKKFDDYAKSTGKSVMVTQTRRFFPNLTLVRKMIKGGLFTPPFDISIYEGGLFNWATESNYLKNPNPNDHGVLHDIGSHIIDYLLTLLRGIGHDPSKIEITKSLFDLDTLSNNISINLNLGDGMGKADIKLSRNMLLMNRLIISDIRNNRITTEPGFHGKAVLELQGHKIIVPAYDYNLPHPDLDESFDTLWENIVSKASTGKYVDDLYAIDAESVLSTAKVIDELVEKRSIVSTDKFFKLSGYDY